MSKNIFEILSRMIMELGQINKDIAKHYDFMILQHPYLPRSILNESKKAIAHIEKIVSILKG